MEHREWSLENLHRDNPAPARPLGAAEGEPGTPCQPNARALGRRAQLKEPERGARGRYAFREAVSPTLFDSAVLR